MGLSLPYNKVKPTGKILTGAFESILWIRVEGRGNFQVSPVIKEFVDLEMNDGRKEMVIDLENCTGMDSTFMGMLAGVGSRLRKKVGGHLSVVGTNEKSRASLDELGLSYLLEIEPEVGPWLDSLEEIRGNLCLLADSTNQTTEEHILECHENLCEADDSNVQRFKTVLEVMGRESVSENGKPD